MNPNIDLYRVRAVPKLETLSLHVCGQDPTLYALYRDVSSVLKRANPVPKAKILIPKP